MFGTGGPLALLNLDLLAGHRPPLPPLRGHSIPGAVTQMTKIREQRNKQRLYQARVQTRNQFGFSKPEQVFNFATKGAGEIVRLSDCQIVFFSFANMLFSRMAEFSLVYMIL